MRWWSVLVALVLVLLMLTGRADASTGDFQVENYATGNLQNNNFLWRGYVFRPSRDVVATGLWGGGGTNCNTGFDGAIFEVTLTGGGTTEVPEYTIGTRLRRVDMRAYANLTPHFAAFAQPLTLRSDTYYLIAQGRVSSGSGCHFATTALDFENLTIGSAIIAEWYPQLDAAYQPSGSGDGSHLVGHTRSNTTPVRTLMGFRYETEVEPSILAVGVPAYLIQDTTNVVLESTLIDSGGTTPQHELTLYFEYAINGSFSNSILVPAEPYRVFGPAQDLPFGATLAGLSHGTTYWVRAVAINEAGRVNGGSVSFTLASLPEGFSVNATVEGVGGSVTPATRVVMEGESTTFVAQPDPDYVLSEMSGCDGSLSGLTYTTGVLSSSCTVVARFAEEVTCEPATAPASISVQDVGTDTATLSWAASTGTDPITYHWSVRRTSDSFEIANGTTSTTSASVTDLSPGSEYAAQVYAANCGGSSDATITSDPFTTQKLAQAPVSGVLADDTITYGADTTTVTASGGSGTGAYEFRQQGGTGEVAFAGEGASRTLTGTAAGTAPIEVRRLGDDTYLDSPWESAGTLTITPAPLQVVAQDADKVYGDAEPALTYEVTGTLYFDDTDDVVTGVVLATATGAGATTGTHAIIASNGSASNYTIDHVDGTLTVTPRPVTVTADDVWKVYAEPPADDPDLTWTLTEGDLAYDDTLEYVFQGALARASGEAVGTYDITEGSLAADANYALSFEPGTLAIRHGPADHLVTVAPAGPQTAGVPFDLVSVTAVDRYGNLADGAHGATPYQGAKTLTYALSGHQDGPDQGDDAVTTEVTFTAGVAVTPLTTTLHRAQETTITASAADLASPQEPDVPSATFEVLAADATHLAFVVQPADTRAATPFDQPPSVAVHDAYGNLAVAVEGSVHVELFGASATLAPAEDTSVPIAAGVATLPCSWVDAPARGVQLHATSAGLTSATSTTFDVTGALVSGVVYVDETASGNRGPDTPGIAGALVGLSDPNGAVSWPDGGERIGAVCTARETDVVITDAEGRYRLPGLDAGTYTLTVSGEAVAAMVRVGRDPFTITAPAFGRYDVDVGFFPGAFVEGVVFRDDGAGVDGVANDAARNGHEAGLGGVLVRGFAAAQVAVPSSAVGEYRLALRLTDPDTVLVSHDTGRATGHTLASGAEDATTLAAGTVGHVAAFEAQPGAVYHLDFGVVPPLRLNGAGEAASGSPGVARFTVAVQPGTPGLVELTADPNRYAWTPRFHPDDTHCSGLTLSSAAPGVWRVSGVWPREPGDDRMAACRVQIDVHVPAGEPAGRVEDLPLRAHLAWSRPEGAPPTNETSALVRLRTTVVEGGHVALTFDASIDGGLTFDERVEAQPGSPVRYRVRFVNTGAQGVHDVMVRLPVADAYTVPGAATELPADLRCPGAPSAQSVLLPYDALTRSLTLDLAAAQTCGLEQLAPGAAGELTLTLEIR